MPESCPHTPFVVSACVTCTVQEGMRALIWQAESLPVLRELVMSLTDWAGRAGWRDDASELARIYAEELAALLDRAEGRG